MEEAKTMEQQSRREGEVKTAEHKPAKCGALNCVPPCRCSPPIPPNHKPVA